MTKIKFKAKKSFKESDAVFMGRSICIALEPECLVLRLKGTRTALFMPYVSAFFYAANAEAKRLREQKQKAREARKAAN